MNRFGGALVVVAVAAGVAGCSGSAERGDAVGPSSGSVASSAAPATHRPSESLRVRQVATFHIRGRAGPMALAEARVVVPVADKNHANWSRVVVLDSASRTQATVARTRFDDGLINWVAVTGDWIAWVDQSRRQSDSEASVLWRIHTLNTRTGEQLLIASNRTRPDPAIPQVRAGAGYFVWTSPERDRSARESMWRPGWPAPRVLLRHAEMTPGSETIAEDHLVYLGQAATQHRGPTVGGDCWAVPLSATGLPTPLTHTALTMGCAVSAQGELVWTEHIDPTRRPLPPDGVLDDPYEVHARAFSSSAKPGASSAAARLLHRGYLPYGWPRAGDGFTVWSDEDGRAVVHGLSDGQQLKLPEVVDALSLTTDGGHELAYAGHRGHTTQVTISQVETSHS